MIFKMRVKIIKYFNKMLIKITQSIYCIVVVFQFFKMITVNKIVNQKNKLWKKFELPMELLKLNSVDELIRSD